jgi:hypothetical protein
MRREENQITIIRNAKWEITINNMEIQKTIRDFFDNPHSNKFENLEETDRFLETCDHQKLNQEDINHLNRSITQNKIEEAIKSLPRDSKMAARGRKQKACLLK